MTDSIYKVETMLCRFAQWKIHHFDSCTYRKSEPFKIGNWTWHLSVEKNKVSSVTLYPEKFNNKMKVDPPIASFIIRVLSSAGNSNAFVHSEIVDRPFTDTEGFVLMIEVPLPGKFIIDIEFLDLKMTPSLKGGVPCSIWPDRFYEEVSELAAIVHPDRTLEEGIHTDITISVDSSEESIGAHRAILVARSPVFRSMFSHNLKENEESVINISDMSIEACRVLLNYLHGYIQKEEFMTHRVALLLAADKYDLIDLRETCLESLLEDVDANNVLERLQIGCLYQLPKLKNGCMQYLVKLGKIFDIRDDFTAFLQSADRELISEVFNEVLDAWKGS